MPHGNQKYDKSQRETLEFKSLYGRYNAPKVRIYRDLFPTFQQFYDWSMANGFVCGAKLERMNYSEPLTPDKFIWIIPEATMTKITDADKNDFIDRWNKTVNRIRIHFGLAPFDNKENESDETLL